MITKLFPVMVANPLCVDLDGAPISYETYGFSPRQARSRQATLPCISKYPAKADLEGGLVKEHASMMGAVEGYDLPIFYPLLVKVAMGT